MLSHKIIKPFHWLLCNELQAPLYNQNQLHICNRNINDYAHNYALCKKSKFVMVVRSSNT